jgi:hypothetical protein
VASNSLSCVAPAVSVPNGFSSTSRVPAGSPTSVSARHAFAVIAGGSAKKITTGPRQAASSPRKSSGRVTSARR